MQIVAVLCVVALFLAALGQTTLWRPEGPRWYGHAFFLWGVFLLALFITWPTLKAML
jgi:hypothetical protein